MKYTEKIDTRVTKETAQAIEEKAKKEKRSKSSVHRMILEEYFENLKNK